MKAQCHEGKTNPLIELVTHPEHNSPTAWFARISVGPAAKTYGYLI